jgi:hypothetical protein
MQGSDNKKFYTSAIGSEILNRQNFTVDIHQFLKSEKRSIQSILENNLLRYDALIEIGCANARNIDLAINYNLIYFGIDYVEREIEHAASNIKMRNISGTVSCLSVMDLNCQTTPIPCELRTICLLPFNIFGNLPDPLNAIKNLNELNYDILLSSYRDDAPNTLIANYYRACGLNDIKVIVMQNGIIFTSTHGFKSIVYSRNFIRRIANKYGYKINVFETCKIGILYYLHKDRSA